MHHSQGRQSLTAHLWSLLTGTWAIGPKGACLRGADGAAQSYGGMTCRRLRWPRRRVTPALMPQHLCTSHRVRASTPMAGLQVRDQNPPTCFLTWTQSITISLLYCASGSAASIHSTTSSSTIVGGVDGTFETLWALTHYFFYGLINICPMIKSFYLGCRSVNA